MLRNPGHFELSKQALKLLHCCDFINTQISISTIQGRFGLPMLSLKINVMKNRTGVEMLHEGYKSKFYNGQEHLEHDLAQMGFLSSNVLICPKEIDQWPNRRLV